jgi:hypothetical protein
MFFPSKLDDGFQQKLADLTWSLTRPGGGVLWFDFIYNNPRNPDVRGVPLHRIRQLFPEGKIHHWKLTLAPPQPPAPSRLSAVRHSSFNMSLPSAGET